MDCMRPAIHNNNTDFNTSCTTHRHHSHSMMYVCVHCGTPCCNSHNSNDQALYRYLTPHRPASIKLTLCTTCDQVADPYLEREGLLVVMDWILLRPPAYRHVLFNQVQLYFAHHHHHSKDNHHSNHTDETYPPSPPSQQQSLSRQRQQEQHVVCLRRMVVAGGIASAIVESYMQWVVVVSSLSSSSTSSFAPSNIQSPIDELWNTTEILLVIGLQLVFVIGISRLVVWWTTWRMIVQIYNINHKKYHQMVNDSTVQTNVVATTTIPPPPSRRSPESSQQPHHHYYDYDLMASAIPWYLAFMIPTAMYVVAIVVMIWENTRMISTLTHVLVWAMQWTAISSLLPTLSFLQRPPPSSTSLPQPQRLTALGWCVLSLLIYILVRIGLQQIVVMILPWFLKTEMAPRTTIATTSTLSGTSPPTSRLLMSLRIAWWYDGEHNSRSLIDTITSEFHNLLGDVFGS